MFAKDIAVGQDVTLKLHIRETALYDFELWNGQPGTVESVDADEVCIRFEFEHNGRDWVDFGYIPRDQVADYFEEFEEDPEED